MDKKGSMLLIEDVEKAYRQQGTEVAALRGVSFQVEQGAFVAITGQSGSGKSTLLHLIAGIDTPSRGVIAVHGQELTGMNETRLARFRRQEIGIVFQAFNLLGNLTVLQNVMLP